MIKYFAIIASMLVLTSCASPTFQMPVEQVASLSDDQLCKFKNGYRGETKLNNEIARRGLNCDRFYRECLNQGNQPGTQPMNFCIAVLRENERLSYERSPAWAGGYYGINSYHHVHRHQYPRHHRHY